MEEATDRLILALYRGARDVPADQFKDWALREVRTLIPFDSGQWIEGRFQPEGATSTSAFLFNQPQEKLDAYREFASSRDFLVRAMVDQPGNTFLITDLIPREELVQTELYQNYLVTYGIEWAAGTAILDPDLGLFSFLSWYRDDPAHPFSEPERQVKQRLTPHLVEAYKTCLFFHLARLDIQDSGYRRPVALIDQAGYLYQATDGFTRWIRSLFPDWAGPVLPSPLLADLSPEKPFHYRGATLTSYHLANDLMQVEIGFPSAFEDLTETEQKVAKAIGQGLTYKETARELQISPSTVTNHMNNIYRKLGLANKAELVTLLAQPQPHSHR